MWREVLADLETPLSAFVKLVGDREGFLLESVEHAERWGRFSFLGRDPARTFVARGRHVEWLGGDAARRRARPTQGTLAALEALLARLPRADARRSCRRSTAASSAGSATTPCARSSACPTCRPTTSASPTRCARSRVRSRRSTTSASGCYLIENVYPPPGADDGDARRDCTTRAVARLDTRGRRARPAVAVPARAAARPTSSTELPEVRAQLHDRRSGPSAVEAAKEHILDGDIFQVVLAQRFDLVEPVDPFAVYRVLRLVNPSPYMYFLRHPEATIVGSSPEPMVQLRDGRVISRPIAGHPPARPQRASTTSGSRPSSSSIRRSAPST